MLRPTKVRPSHFSPYGALGNAVTDQIYSNGSYGRMYVDRASIM